MEFRFPCGGGGGGSGGGGIASDEIPLSSDPQSRLPSVGRSVGLTDGQMDGWMDGPRNVNHIARIRVAVSQLPSFVLMTTHRSLACSLPLLLLLLLLLLRIQTIRPSSAPR